MFFLFCQVKNQCAPFLNIVLLEFSSKPETLASFVLFLKSIKKNEQTRL